MKKTAETHTYYKSKYDTAPLEVISAPEKSPVTVEVVAYAVVFVIAALLRFSALGYAPLLNEEADVALHSWRFYQGQGMDAVNYSPLLTHGTALAFFLFGDSDAAARILPALFGTLMVLLPYLLRRELGKVGALVTTALLAISPSFLHFSRRVDAAIIVAAGALTLIVAIFSYLREREARYIYLGTGALAIMLIAGSDAYTVIVLCALFFFVVGLLQRGDKTVGVDTDQVDAELLKPSFTQPFAVAGHSVREDSGNWRRGAVIIFGVILLIGAFALGLNQGGFQAALNLLAEWLGGFGGTSPNSIFYHLQLLFFYELVPLLFAWGGILYYLAARWEVAESVAPKHETALVVFLGYWFVFSLVFHTALRSAAGSILITVLPLILLTGWACDKFLAPWLANQLEWLSKSRQQKLDLSTNSLLLVPLALPPIAFLGLQLATYTYQEQPEFLLLAAITLVLIVTLITLWSWLGGSEARRAGLVIILLVAMATQIRVGWGLSFAHAHSSYELMYWGPTSPDVRYMLVTLDQYAEHQQVERKHIKMAVQEDLPTALRWYLRDFTLAKYVSDVRLEGDMDILIAEDETGAKEDFKGPKGFIGQTFRLHNYFTPEELSSPDVVEWVLYHKLTSGTRGIQDIKLWIRQGGSA